jgi:hypothetical protein
MHEVLARPVALHRPRIGREPLEIQADALGRLVPHGGRDEERRADRERHARGRADQKRGGEPPRARRRMLAIHSALPRPRSRKR